MRVLEQARKTFGDDEALTMRMANVYEGGGRLAEAEKELRRLMAEDPLNADAMNSLGYMLADRGLRLPEAVDLAQRAVKIEPGNPAYLDTLGWALFKQGRTDEAAEPLAKAAAVLTGNSVIQDHHGDVLDKRGPHGRRDRRVGARARRRRRADRSRRDREEDQGRARSREVNESIRLRRTRTSSVASRRCGVRLLAATCWLR